MIAIKAAAVLTAPLLLPTEPRRSYCGDCRGSGFPDRRNNGARRCQRCRGRGFTLVGKTKR